MRDDDKGLLSARAGFASPSVPIAERKQLKYRMELTDFDTAKGFLEDSRG